MATLAGPEAGTQRLLVGRKGRGFVLNAHPLLIDPERESVEVLTHELPDFETAQDVTDYKDRLYYLKGSPAGIGLFRLGPPTWKPEPLRRGLPQGELRIVDGRAHIIGKRWWSIELETEFAKPVGPYVAAGELPWYFENKWFYPGQGGYAPVRLQPGVERMSKSVYSNHYRLIVSSQRLRPVEGKFCQPIIHAAAKK